MYFKEIYINIAHTRKNAELFLKALYKIYNEYRYSASSANFRKAIIALFKKHNFLFEIEDLKKFFPDLEIENDNKKYCLINYTFLRSSTEENKKVGVLLMGTDEFMFMDNKSHHNHFTKILESVFFVYQGQGFVKNISEEKSIQIIKVIHLIICKFFKDCNQGFSEINVLKCMIETQNNLLYTLNSQKNLLDLD